MDTCEVKSPLIWSIRNVENLVSDIFRIVGQKKAKKFKITLISTTEEKNFVIIISGPEEYRNIIKKMSNQEKV